MKNLLLLFIICFVTAANAQPAITFNAKTEG